MDDVRRPAGPLDAISAGPISQVAWVTDDLDATEAVIGPQFGVGAWTRMPDIHFAPDACTLRGRPADFVAHVSLAYSADLQLELIQPVRGESIYAEHLEQRGPGLHHVCFEVDDIDAAVARAAENGWECVLRGSMAGLMEFAYLDLTATGASYVELARISGPLREIYASIRAGS